MQVNTCAITRDGKKVVSGSWDNTLKVWDIESGNELLAIKVWDMESYHSPIVANMEVCYLIYVFAYSNQSLRLWKNYV